MAPPALCCLTWELGKQYAFFGMHCESWRTWTALGALGRGRTIIAGGHTGWVEAMGCPGVMILHNCLTVGVKKKNIFIGLAGWTST